VTRLAARFRRAIGAWRLRSDEREHSAGFTIIELAIAMLVFSIVAVIVTDQLNLMPRLEGRLQNSAASSDQVTSAFLTLDGEVRYAADINHPWTDATGNYWDEFESDWTSATTGYPQCTELEYVNSSGVLQQRTWSLTNISSPAAPSGTAWRPLATGLASSPATTPFALNQAGPSWAVATQQQTSSAEWQLTLNLTASAGKGTSGSSSASTFTITSIDISSASKNRNICGGAP
jgi:prepilin-type N-terminal cleavage/methylation domain-containing protein